MSRFTIDYSDFDESSARTRPSKRGSRPRTKQRPEHHDAALGRVIAVDRGRYTVYLPAQQPGGRSSTLHQPRTVVAMRAKEMRRTAIVVGDRVAVVGDLSGADGTLARIVRLADRQSVLRRSADDSDTYERIVVANVDLLVIVVAAADPEPRTGFIDRALVAAFDAGITPLLCVTKTDVASAQPLVDHYADVDLEIITTSRDPHTADHTELNAEDVHRLAERLTGHRSALVGPSGVGKSTLLNALTGADRATGHINPTTGRGRHTSSSAVAVPLRGEHTDDTEPSWLIDTPGIRSFGLGLVDPDDVVAGFQELLPAIADCPRGCTHREQARECALDDWVDSGHAGSSGPARLASLRRLLANRVSSPGDEVARG
ncbi:ribosome small subunit-dependent GTPase A [Auritidibacter ignavus]|uniref:ribosome small subunit-dependent GTPase A n=1 Tax=Auritidibacter ignavus TaxID=678932 RepID=UPI002448C7A3|nr:ribosome small subunit-dependent GTPase A [Auritidibacter ignavus]WGH84020.1 ribosome small subunit-dependent GTPase A [Auritidibacter ignavus]WHS28304.1 ribosome small subunit-dependent GTPase A [Auritidibacter ignavus]